MNITEIKIKEGDVYRCSKGQLKYMVFGKPYKNYERLRYPYDFYYNEIPKKMPTVKVNSTSNVDTLISFLVSEKYTYVANICQRDTNNLFNIDEL